jgi:hypothetical protein
MSDLRQRLDGGEVIILYRAMDTEFEKLGVPIADAAWCAPALGYIPGVELRFSQVEEGVAYRMWTASNSTVGDRHLAAP